MHPDDRKEKPVLPHEEVVIHIDNKMYRVPQKTTGTELKKLAGITDAFDLFKITPGPSDDIKIDSSSQLELKNGDHFYSVPKTLNPGTANAVA